VAEMGQQREAKEIYETGAGVWHKAQRCSNSSCVEVASSGDRVLVRDGKETNGAILSYTREEWLIFVAGVKAGDFDDVA
jgi:hypothetical protein